LHSNTKYVLMQIFAGDFTKDPHYRPLCDSKSFRAVCQVFGMVEELDAWEASQKAQGYPYDLDAHPKKTPLPAPETTAEVASSFCSPSSTDAKTTKTATTPVTAKRKIDELEVGQEQENKEETSSPAAKVAKTTASDGSTFQPTPADTPQPVELE
jgi:hypothetical protein